MHDWLMARAQATPTATALIIGERTWTYAQLHALVERLCARLARRGVVPGQHVGVLLPNSLEYVCLVHALARLGAVLVPLNTRLAPTELAWQLEHAGCTLLIYAPETAEHAPAAGERCMRIDVAALNNTSPEPTPVVPRRPFALESLQAIVFTSGTTGQPKGAMLTFANHFWSATASSYRLGVLPNDRWLSCLPLYHVGGLAVIFRSCLYGTAVVLHERFDPEAFNHSLDRQRITLVSLVPTMLHRLLAVRGDRPWPATLRLVLLGGAAATPALLEECLRGGVPVAPTYGLTEAASQVATMRPEDARRKPGSVGTPLMFSSVRVVDAHGVTLPPGESGEIVVRGPTVMPGYYRNPGATAAAIRDGKLYTGDIGYVDAEGDLWIVERRSDIIISGGENISPAEVEAVLTRHPAVAQACVVGIPDAEWGQRVAALIVLREPHQISAAELADFCRRHLARYKQPRLISFADHLPQTASGKIARRAVVEQLVCIAGEPPRRS